MGGGAHCTLAGGGGGGSRERLLLCVCGYTPARLARGGSWLFRLKRIGAVRKLAANICGRRVATGANHHAVLKLVDHRLLVARVQELDPSRLRRVEHTP